MKALFILLISFSATAGIFEQDCLLALGKAADGNETKACKLIENENALACVQHFGISADASIIEACSTVVSASDRACVTAPGADLADCLNN